MRRLATLCLAAACAIALAAAPALAGGEDDEPTLEEAEPESTPRRTEDYRQTLELAIDDIQAYWADQYDDHYGEDYKPIPEERIFAAKPGVKLPKCQGTALSYDDAEDNAFYCYIDNYIAYDDVGLFPRLFRDFGAMSVALVMAHEWGHAIQDRAGNAYQHSVFKELQADCFAGSWLGRVAAGQATGINLEGGNLDAAIGAMIEFRDPVGTSAEEQGAHGSGFDRVAAFQHGFDEGPSACVPYFETPPLIVEIPFTDEQDAASGGNAPAEKVIPVSVDVLNDFYTQAYPDYIVKSIEDVYGFDSTGTEAELPTCGGSPTLREEVENRVFYCIDDDKIGYDQPYLQHIYEDIGDFGVMTLVANPWATYVQSQQDFPGFDANADSAVLGADCYTGGFAAALYNEELSSDELGKKGQDETIILSPGDLDEAIQAFIDYSGARGIASDIDATFMRVRAFRDGFLNGYNTCAAYASGEATFE